MFWTARWSSAKQVQMDTYSAVREAHGSSRNTSQSYENDCLSQAVRRAHIFIFRIAVGRRRLLRSNKRLRALSLKTQQYGGEMTWMTWNAGYRFELCNFMSMQYSSENVKEFSANDPGEFSLHNTVDLLKANKPSLVQSTCPRIKTIILHCSLPFPLPSRSLPVLTQVKFFNHFSSAVIINVEIRVFSFNFSMYVYCSETVLNVAQDGF